MNDWLDVDIEANKLEFPHGNYVHGESLTSEYYAWKHINQRCYNSNNRDYEDYGGRGIKVYTEWRSNFVAFLNYVGKKPTRQHSLDRIDTYGDYRPGNVRWALPIVQANNRRNNIIIEHDGTKQSLGKWAEETGIKYHTLRSRLKHGWNIEDALSIGGKNG